MDKNIRNKQLREILDSDININRRLTSIQMKNIPKDEIIQPHIQINNVELQRFALYQ